MVVLAVLKNENWGEQSDIPAPKLVGNGWEEQPNNNNKIIINPKKDFKGKTSYYVHIEPMSISTEYGIFYGGINIDDFWSFTTAVCEDINAENLANRLAFLVLSTP